MERNPLSLLGPIEAAMGRMVVESAGLEEYLTRLLGVTPEDRSTHRELFRWKMHVEGVRLLAHSLELEIHDMRLLQEEP